MKGKCEGTKEKLGSEIERDCELICFQKVKPGQPVDFYFYFALGNVFSHFEKKTLISHIFLKPPECPFS